MIGDEGTVSDTTIQSTTGTADGNDTITVGNGDNIVLGGLGDDSLTVGTGNNLIVGDRATITRDLGGVSIAANFVTVSAGGQVRSIVTTDAGTAAPANDTITVGAGNNVILGGGGQDEISVPNGNNVILGDNGVVTFAANGQLTSAESDLDTIGGRDTINVGDGHNTIIGGFADDQIETGTGNNVVIGDGGSATFATNGDRLTAAGLTANGAADEITISNGNSIVIGGGGADEITLGDGANIVLGDGGTIDYASVDGNSTYPDIVESISSVDDGDDTITAGNGGVIIVGGNGDDRSPAVMGTRLCSVTAAS